MNVTKSQLRRLIREELAKGVPEFALTRLAEEAVVDCADKLLKILVTHTNQVSIDAKDRSKRYAAANKVCSALKRDREFIKTIEEKLQENLLDFLNSV